MPLFISRGVDRSTRKDLAAIRRALERIADSLDIAVGKTSGPALRSFYRDDGKPAHGAPEADLAYVDDEEAWLIEEAERRGVQLEDLREMYDYDRGKVKGPQNAEAEETPPVSRRR